MDKPPKTHMSTSLGSARIRLEHHPLPPPGLDHRRSQLVSVLLELLIQGVVFWADPMLLGVTLPLSLFASYPLFGFALWWLFCTLLGRPRVRLRLTPQQLKLADQSILLDDIDTVSQHRSRWRRLRPGVVRLTLRNGQQVQVADGMPRDEATWLTEQLRDAVDTRREQLSAAGHDLSVGATVPQELQTMRGATATAPNPTAR